MRNWIKSKAKIELFFTHDTITVIYWIGTSHFFDFFTYSMPMINCSTLNMNVFVLYLQYIFHILILIWFQFSFHAIVMMIHTIIQRNEVCACAYNVMLFYSSLYVKSVRFLICEWVKNAENDCIHSNRVRRKND